MPETRQEVKLRNLCPTTTTSKLWWWQDPRDPRLTSLRSVYRSFFPNYCLAAKIEADQLETIMILQIHVSVCSGLHFLLHVYLILVMLIIFLIKQIFMNGLALS